MKYYEMNSTQPFYSILIPKTSYVKNSLCYQNASSKNLVEQYYIKPFFLVFFFVKMCKSKRLMNRPFSEPFDKKH